MESDTITGRVEMELAASGREAGRIRSSCGLHSDHRGSSTAVSAVFNTTDSTDLSLSKPWVMAKDRGERLAPGARVQWLTERLSSDSHGLVGEGCFVLVWFVHLPTAPGLRGCGALLSCEGAGASLVADHRL